MVIALILDDSANRLQILNDIFEPLICLALRHKHRSFSEEKELRFSVITSMNDGIPDEATAKGTPRIQKKLRFRTDNGILIPYVSLFDFNEGKEIKDMDILPIKKIIVGPHPEKNKRKRSVEKMLNQLSLDAEVTTSNIPYLP